MAGPNARNSFDTEDDEHLIEFIAKNNPLLSGRQGNKLYKKLEANEHNQWPWSKHHPWQSWRERYRKNTDYFDYKVRKYQKGNKHDKRPREVVEKVDGDKKVATKPAMQSQPARGTTKEKKPVSKRLEEKVVPVDTKKEAEPSQGEGGLMRELFGSYVEEENELAEPYESEPAPNEPRHQSPQTNGRPELVAKIPQSKPTRIPKKSKLRQFPDNEDPFETPPPTPSAPLSPIRYVGLPTLVEGPFRTVLKRPRAGDDASWPPARKKKLSTEDLGKAIDPMPLPMAQPPARPPNAVASSSKISLPDPKPKVTAPEPAPVAALPQREHDAQIMVASDSDPFVSKQIPSKVKGKGKVLDMTDIVTTTSPPRIDLHRQSMQKRLNPSTASSRRGSLLSTRSSTTSESHRNRNRKSRSLRHSISELDFSDDGKEFALRAAQEMASNMARMARDHGVSTEIAMKTYTKTGSIERTKVILEHFRKTLLAAEQEIYQRMPPVGNHTDDNANTDDEVPDGLIPTPPVPPQVSTREGTPPKNKRRSSTKRRNPRPSLIVKPLPPDHDELDTQSEYSPPTGSRAGQFVKLTRRGRAEEALAREKELVALGAVPPTRSTEPNGAFPHVADTSPSPLSRVAAADTVPDEQDDDDIYMRTDDEQPSREADEEAEIPQAKEQSPIHSITRKLIKRISGGRENDPALLALAKEHRIHALNVHTDNADEMRAFEATNNSDLLRMWTMNLVNEMVAQNKGYLHSDAEIGDEALEVD